MNDLSHRLLRRAITPDLPHRILHCKKSSQILQALCAPKPDKPSLLGDRSHTSADKRTRAVSSPVAILCTGTAGVRLSMKPKRIRRPLTRTTPHARRGAQPGCFSRPRASCRITYSNGRMPALVADLRAQAMIRSAHCRNCTKATKQLEEFRLLVPTHHVRPTVCVRASDRHPAYPPPPPFSSDDSEPRAGERYTA